MARINLLFLLFVIAALTLTYNRFFSDIQPASSTSETATTPSAPAQTQDAEFTRLTRDVHTLKAEVTALKIALKQNRQAISAQTPSTVPSSVDVDEAAQSLTAADRADVRATENAMQQDGESRFNEQILTLEERFTYETTDTDWSGNKTDSIQTALNALLNTTPGAAVLAMECRSSLCRLEIEYDDPNAQNTLELELPMAVSESLPRMAVQHERIGNTIRGIYYLQDDETEEWG